MIALQSFMPTPINEILIKNLLYEIDKMLTEKFEMNIYLDEIYR